jgi:integrase
MVLGTFRYHKYFPKSNQCERFREIERRSTQLQADTPPFREFAEVWITENRVTWKRSYESTLMGSLTQHVYPAFGDLPVGNISRADILAFRAKLAELPGKSSQSTLSAARINTIMVPLRMILREAAERFEFPNPYRNIKQLKVPRTKVEPFSLNDVNRIIQTVREDFRPYFTVRFFTGMRSGEVHGLKWKYVDFERRQILVRESLVRGEMTDTKTQDSSRDIRMSAQVYAALQEQHKRTGRFDFVFCSGKGQPLSINNVDNRVWRPLLRHLGLEHRRMYQTRHTAATLWLSAGENPLWVAQMLGHVDTTMVLSKYARYQKDLTRRDGSAFDAVWNQFTEAASDESRPSTFNLTRPQEDNHE